MRNKRCFIFKKYICLLSLLSILITSCLQSNLEPYNPPQISTLGPCPNSQFIGEWRGAKRGKWLSSILEYEYVDSDYYTFSDNNQIKYTGFRHKYGILMKTYRFIYEWKEEGGKYYTRLWNNEYSSWSEIKLEYINNSQIKIDSVIMERQIL